MSGSPWPFTTIDIAGAENIYPSAINSTGEIIGQFDTSVSGAQQGFLYDAGTVTTIDVAGANDTYPVGINTAGDVVGYFLDGTISHGFLDSGGTITTIDIQGADRTGALGINTSGQIMGYYVAASPSDTGPISYGFLETGTTIETFDGPGDVGVTPEGMNDAGTIVGFLNAADADGDAEGFAWNAGSITLITVPNSTYVVASAINNTGEIAGYYGGADGNAHGFTDIAGVVTTFDITGIIDIDVNGLSDSGEITGFGNVDGTVEGFLLDGGTATFFSVPGSTSTSTTEINADGTLVAQAVASGGISIAAFAVACYAAGTRIATANGDTAVETLLVGEHVRSAFGGTAPVVWVGHRRVSCRDHPRPREVWPIRVQRGAFADNVPARDLLLSPDHAVLVDDVLIPIRHLINHLSIRQEPVAEVTYCHLELPTHDVVLAEGLASESYLDTGNRHAFTGAQTSRPQSDAQAIWQAEACAPQITHGPIHEAVMARLGARAVAMQTRQAA